MDDPLEAQRREREDYGDFSRGAQERAAGQGGKRWGGKQLAIAAVGLVVLIVVVVEVTRPGGVATRPAGATDASVVGSVVQALRRCAAVTTATPPDNCPQRTGLFADTGRWALYGDPAKGAKVTYKGNSVFSVRGHAAMAFTASGGATEFDPTVYDAEVHWAGESSTATVTRATDPADDITLPADPALDEQAVQGAVKAAVSACAAASAVRQPPDCPLFSDPFPTDSPVHYALAGDPVAAWQYSYDAQFGVARADASFTATASIADPGFSPRPVSANYEAVVVDDAGAAKVIVLKRR